MILAVDVMTQGEALVYGREALEQIAEGDASSELLVLRIAIDAETDELERLIALVQTIKGHHDYQQ